jgi:esterase/lipase superfamily enzyme
LWVVKTGQATAFERLGVGSNFSEKAIPAWVYFWGDVNHDWPWWYTQMDCL